jgi:hypothetical protein
MLVDNMLTIYMIHPTIISRLYHQVSLKMLFKVAFNHHFSFHRHLNEALAFLKALTPEPVHKNGFPEAAPKL